MFFIVLMWFSLVSLVTCILFCLVVLVYVGIVFEPEIVTSDETWVKLVMSKIVYQEM